MLVVLKLDGSISTIFTTPISTIQAPTWLFGAAAAALLVASLGFWLIREPPHVETSGKIPPWREYAGQLRGAVRRLRKLVGVQILTGFSLMAFPFYIVYARQRLGAPPEAIAWFILNPVGRRSWPARVLLVFGLTLTTGTMCV
jgi:hypothetical protein